MKVVITGGAGFLGKKLARRLLQSGIAGPSGKPEQVSELMLFDVVKASGPGLDDPRVKALAGDIANFATVQSIVQGAATVFHFAAVVSAGGRSPPNAASELVKITRGLVPSARQASSTLRVPSRLTR